MQDAYIQLAKHLENLIMGYPYTEELLDLLKEMFSPDEARVAIAIPNNLPPLEVVGIVLVVIYLHGILALGNPTLDGVVDSVGIHDGADVEDVLVYELGDGVIGPVPGNQLVDDV